MRKEIRIDGATGRILDSERNVHVHRDTTLGGKDKIRWIIVGTTANAPFRVHFAHTPFNTADTPQDINVSDVTGRSATFTVKASVDTYKYSVYDNTNTKTHDPNIIIDS